MIWIKDRCGDLVQESRSGQGPIVPSGGGQREFR